MADLITCKSDVDSIKNEIAIVQTTSNEVYGPSRAGNSHANSRTWAKIELAQDYTVKMPDRASITFDDLCILHGRCYYN